MYKRQVIHEPESAYGYAATKLVRDLNIGAIVDHGVVDPINREKIFNQYRQMAENKLTIEKIRTGIATLMPEKFIEVAHGK